MSQHLFLLVVIISVIGTINNNEQISELTFMLMMTIIPTVLLMSFYMSGDLNRVLNRTKDNKVHGSERNKDTDI